MAYNKRLTIDQLCNTVAEAKLRKDDDIYHDLFADLYAERPNMRETLTVSMPVVYLIDNIMSDKDKK